MLIKMPGYYREFKCAAGKCPDSCCDGWKINVDEKTAKIYRQHQGTLHEKIEKYLTDENYFVLNGSRCPFLNEANLCDIYINIGKDKLCGVCSSFPRRVQKTGDVMYAGLNLSCPEVMRLILKRRNGIKFITLDDGKGGVGEKGYMQTEEAFNAIINDRRFTWRKRLIMVIFLADRIRDEDDVHQADKYVKSAEIARLSSMLPDDSDIFNREIRNTIAGELLETYGNICFGRKHESLTITLLRDYFEKEKKPKNLREIPDNYTCQYENFVTCSIFRNITECKTPADIFEMIVKICVSYAVVRELDGLCLQKYGYIDRDMQIEIMHYYCKIMEHSGRDLSRLLSVMERGNYKNMAHLMVLV